ncbi:hypothetical protein GW17_00061055, partial [Ensete ventricosum]
YGELEDPQGYAARTYPTPSFVTSAGGSCRCHREVPYRGGSHAPQEEDKVENLEVVAECGYPRGYQGGRS